MRMMRRLITLAGAYVVTLGVCQTRAANQTVISYASFNERTAGALFVAEDQGFFRKQGLDVRLVYVRAGNVALSALAAGESPFYFGSGTGVTLGAVAGGLDGGFVAGLGERLKGPFIVPPQIKSPAELKGKSIGVQSIGGGIWMITMLVLDHWGLEPKRDRISL